MIGVASVRNVKCLRIVDKILLSSTVFRAGLERKYMAAAAAAVAAAYIPLSAAAVAAVYILLSAAAAAGQRCISFCLWDCISSL